MKKLRVATYNVEWMNNLFVTGKAQFRATGGKAMGRNPKEPRVVAERIAGVIDDLDAHIIGIQEGPSRAAQMELFVAEYLDGNYKVFGRESGAQSIYALVRKDSPVKVAEPDKIADYYRRLTRPVAFQPWGEVNRPKEYKMARPPALLRLSRAGSKKLVHVVVAHTKSQFTKGFTKKAFDARQPKAMQAAILARQKLSADIAALRRHVTNVILEDSASAAIVMGDINDGFSRSVFETEFLLQSLVDELRGSFRRQSALLDHVLTEAQLRVKDSYTVEFRSPEKKGITRELIDHILVTPALRDGDFWLQTIEGSGRIAHGIVSKHTDGTGAAPDDRPSDHVPVYVDLAVS